MKKSKKVTLADLPYISRGTPAGEWFRRHWLVVGASRELRDVPQAVKALGEELVLFRDDRGRIGLLGLHCPHHGTSLDYGDIEDGGIRCPYHGWLFDLGGHSLAATRVISWVISQFQLEIPLQSLFQSPTVAEMAVIIIQNRTKRASNAEPAGMLRDVEAMIEDVAQRHVDEINVTVSKQ